MAKILLVEEEPAVRNLICRLLATVPEYEVTAAVGGWQGLFLMEKQEYDLVITDWMMSDLNGHLMLDNAKMARRPAKRVIVVSGSFVPASEQLEQDRQFFLEFLAPGGYLELIAKPFDVNYFLPAVKRALAYKFPG